MKRNAKKNKGITLIALVITIIVLLILAGVTIASLSGDNGILTRAAQSKEQTKKADVEEQIKLGLTEVLMESNLGKGTLETLLNNKFGSGNVTKNVEDGSFTIKKDGYQVKVDSKGTIVGEAVPEGNVVPPTPPQEPEKEAIPENESYVKYYADFEGGSEGPDGIIDGIIFVDIAADTGKEKTWSTNGYNTTYKINKPTAEQGNNKVIYKEYYIDEVKNDKIDSNKAIQVVKPKPRQQAGKKDRFYVMALNDYGRKDETSRWFAKAYGKMPTPVTDTLTGCGYQTIENEEKIIGRHNTLNMIDIAKTGKWKDTNNGNQNIITDGNDIWLKLSNDKKVTEGKWFLPSKDEWVAYAGELGITCGTEGNRKDGKYLLKDWYWSSSQTNNCNAWRALFYYGCMDSDYVSAAGPVRLAATF